MLKNLFSSPDIYLRRLLTALGALLSLGFGFANADISDQLTITIQPADLYPPAAVADLSATAGSEGQALLSWTAPLEDTGVIPTNDPVSLYEIRVSRISLQSWLDSGNTLEAWWDSAQIIQPPPTLPPGSPQSLLVNLPPGVEYFFALRSRDDAGLYSPIDTLAPTPQQARVFLEDLPPAAPSGFTASVISTFSIVLTWNDLTQAQKGPDFDSYRLYRSTQETGPFMVIASTTATAYADSSVVGGTTHYYRLTARDRGEPLSLGPTLESASVSVSIFFGNFVPPEAPLINPQETFAISESSIKWTWSYSGAPPDGFRVISLTGEPVSPNLPPSARVFVQTGLAPNQGVSVFVQAFTNIGMRSNSPPQTRFTWAKRPTNLIISSVTDQSVSLSWNSNNNPAGTQFILERGPRPSGPWLPIGVTTKISFSDISVAESAIYHYRIRARNNDGIFTPYEGPLSTRTLTLPPGPLTDLTAQANTEVGKRIDFTWTNPPDPDLAGVLIIRSTEPIVASPEQFVSYSVGQKLGNGVVVYNSVASPQTYPDPVNRTFTTYYYLLFTRDEVPNYGSGVAIEAFSLPAIDSISPLPVGGLRALRLPDKKKVVLNWSPVMKNADPNRTLIEDLVGYRVERSTGLGDDKVVLSTVGVFAASYEDTLDPSATYYYAVRAVDFSGNLSQDSPIVEVAGEQKTFFVKGPMLIKLTNSAADTLLASNNSIGKDIVLEVESKPQEETSNVLRSVKITARDAESNTELHRVSFDPKEFDLVFSFEASSFPAKAYGAALLSAQAREPKIPSPATVGVYWFNGLEWLNLQGQVDDKLKTISVQQPNLGLFQVRSQVRPSAFNLDASGVRPKIITPNGDGKNDFVIFYFDNPNNARITGKIFDINGAFVANIEQSGPVVGITLKWDGKDYNGHVVPMGVYVYRLEAEGKSFTGTVVVAR